MPTRDTSAEYGRVSRFNHWFGALTVIILLTIGLYFHEMPRGLERDFWLRIHIGIGALSFLFIAFRVLWRLISHSPDPAPQARLMQRLSKLTHSLILLGIILMFLSGPLIIWTAGQPVSPFGLFSIPSPTGAMHEPHEWLEELHEVISRSLLVLVIIHVLAVLKHRLLNPPILHGRMWGRRY